MGSGSLGLRLALVALSVIVATGFVAGIRWARIPGEGGQDNGRSAGIAAAGAVAWMGLTLLAARAGLLRFSPFPPTMFLLVGAVLVLAVGVGRSALGRRLALGLPLAALVGFQAFRVLVELILHRAFVEGVLPVQMTYSGRNFDIVTGVTAAVLGLVLMVRPLPRWVLQAWNLTGLALLVNVVTIAMLSAPTPFRRFPAEPSTALVTGAPWVWLPAVLVLAALLGHVVMFRRLAATAQTAAAA